LIHEHFISEAEISIIKPHHPEVRSGVEYRFFDEFKWLNEAPNGAKNYSYLFLNRAKGG
jgi:hypothetical protein